MIIYTEIYSHIRFVTLIDQTFLITISQLAKVITIFKRIMIGKINALTLKSTNTY